MQTIYLTAYDKNIIGKIYQNKILFVVFCDGSLNGYTVNLPKAFEMIDKDITLQKTDASANKITLNVNGGYIGDNQTYELSIKDQYVRLVSDGVIYRILT